MNKMSLSFCEYGRGELTTGKLIKNLVVDCTDMKWGVSASIPRVHVRPVEQQVLQVLHHPISTDLGSIY